MTKPIQLELEDAIAIAKAKDPASVRFERGLMELNEKYIADVSGVTDAEVLLKLCLQYTDAFLKYCGMAVDVMKGLEDDERSE